MVFDDYHFDNSHNDCQSLVCSMYPEVANLLQWLVHYAPSRMTGTGSCVFAMFEHEEDAKNIQEQLPPNWQSFVAQGTDRSPLQKQLTVAQQAIVKK